MRRRTQIHRWFICSALLLVVSNGVVLGSDGSADIAAHSQPAWWLVVAFGLHGTVIWVLSRRRYLVRKNGVLEPAFIELQEFGAYLLAGTVIAQFWVNGDPSSYLATMHTTFATFPLLSDGIDLHFLINDVFMALFFGIAAKELAEATMKPEGALRGNKAILPLVACAGGVVAPALVFRRFCTAEMSHAWAVPCATDIAFAWLGARAIWGRTHPAVTFLLALAVADDFAGMGIIAICYPQRELNPSALALVAAGVVVTAVFRRAARGIAVFRSWQIYSLPAVMCWFGMYRAGLHSALALVFVVPLMPMSGRDKGIFAAQESLKQTDAINGFQRTVKPFVDAGLFFFGLANAGVAWWNESIWDQNSWAVFLGLGLGKTIGITLIPIIAYLLLDRLGFRVTLPNNGDSNERLQWNDLPIIGLLGAMGFTVSLFVADAAGGQPSLKLGALASFIYLGIAVSIGKATRGSARGMS